MKSMMKKMILALSILGLVAIVAPRPASAHVSLFFGLPGVSLFAGPPVYAPPVYGPPVVYAPPPAALLRLRSSISRVLRPSLLLRTRISVPRVLQARLAIATA